MTPSEGWTASTLSDSNVFLVPAWHRKRGVLTHPFKVLFLALQVRKERRQLAGQSDEALADLGLTRSKVVAEAHREFFDIPQDRLDAMYR